jgi:hypothetical protein
MTRDELRDRITVEEFQQWFILERIEPFGEYGEWMRAGVIASTMANIHRGKDTPAFAPTDFMPETFRPKKVETPRTMKEKWMAIMTAQNTIVQKLGGKK